MAKTKKQKVFVAMSGGVDSSTTAALLCKKRKYDVSGIFIRGWYPFDSTQGKPKIACTWREDRRDAMRVCAILGIPFYTFDFSNEYKKHIIDYMINEYKEGRTPNPDVMCNKYIKFDAFLKKAKKMGADKIATGHHARLRRKILNSKFEILNKPQSSKPKIQITKLLQAKDKNKDQSYFLWTLTQSQLKHCLFPIGEYKKDKVREMAKKFKLPVSQKKDSQGLCFVGEFKMEDFLKEHINPKPGKLLNEKGEKIGEHNGVQYYTIGQRHGTGAQGNNAYYVVKKDLTKNILVVSGKPHKANFLKKEIETKDVNWISGALPDTSKKYLGRIRYRQRLQKCKLSFDKLRIPSKVEGQITDCRLRVTFDKPQKSVAPGQSLVIYSGDILLGGGIII